MHRKAKCECGCGEAAPIATMTRANLGHVKGQPIRFINGHHRRKEPEGRYSAIHAWMRSKNPKTGICEECCKNTEDPRARPTEYAFDHTKGKHTRNREDYRELCRSCHVKWDYSMGRYDTDAYRNRNRKEEV